MTTQEEVPQGTETHEKEKSNEPKQPVVQRPRLTMTQLFVILKDEKNQGEIKQQLAGLPEIKRGLDATDLKEYRIDNLSKSARLSDLEDDITASWRVKIRTSKIAKIDTLILSELVGGIINAKRLEPSFDNRILILIGVGVFLFVSFMWGPAISYWLQANWNAIDANTKTIMVVFVLIVIVSAFLYLRKRRQRR